MKKRGYDTSQGRWEPMPHAASQDNRLSLKARGLLALLLSYPDGRAVTLERLAQTCGEGIKALRTGMAELRDHGYVTYDRTQDSAGHWTTDFTVSAEPTTPTDYPQTAQSVPDDRLTQKGTVGATSQNTDLPSSDRLPPNGTVGPTSGNKRLPSSHRLTQKRSVKEPKTSKTKKDSLSDAAPDPQLSVMVETREIPFSNQKPRLSSAQRALTGSTLTDDEQPRFITWATITYNIRGPGWWTTAAGDIPALIEKWRADTAPPPGPYTEPPDPRADEQCPEHGDPWTRGYCMSCRFEFDNSAWYLHHYDRTVDESREEKRCPEHTRQVISRCALCFNAHGNFKHWLHNTYTGHDKRKDPNHNGPDFNPRKPKNPNYFWDN